MTIANAILDLTLLLPIVIALPTLQYLKVVAIYILALALFFCIGFVNWF